MRETVMMPVVLKVPGMEKVKVRADLAYSDAADKNLLMDVYTPPDTRKEQKIPAVIFVHGGAGSEFTPKDWGFYRSWGRLIAASGLAAVTFTHRLAPQRKSFDDSAADLDSAIDFVRRNAEKLNVDKDRICLAAYSAGGVLLAGPMRDKAPYIRCLVNFYAYMDVQQAGNLFVKNESKDRLKEFSPIYYLDKDANRIAPLFIARAGLDQVPTINDSIDRFIKEARSKNAAITVMEHPAGVHGFDSQNDDERSREIVRSAIEFMKKNLQKRP